MPNVAFGGKRTPVATLLPPIRTVRVRHHPPTSDRDWFAMRLFTAVAPLALVIACAPDTRIAEVESALPSVMVDGTTLHLSLAKWMDTLGVPGVSIAVIDDYRIVWAKGYGTMDIGDPSAMVTPSTIFQAASIAKPVTALAVLHHAERGAFDLDADIRTLLRSWSLPTRGAYADSKVTLRQLLSHAAGISDGGFAGYERATALPTTVQILNGDEPALNTAATIQRTPGEAVAYSGLGYTMIELALVDQLRAPFETIVTEAVFRPLQMRNSTFALEPAERFAGHVAKGHLGSGAVIPDGWLVYPELAAAGLWTTPSDLAQVAIDVSNAWSGRSANVLTPESARRMLTPQLERMGLGFVVRPADTLGFFSHSGGNQGYRAHMEMLARVGKGVVVMTNSDAGHPLSALITLAVARAYGWPDTAQRRVSDANAQLLGAQIAAKGVRRARVPISPTVLARYSGRYELAPGFEFDIAADTARGRLLVRLGDQARLPAYATSDRDFFFEAVDAQISFVADRTGRVTALILHQGGRDQEAKRLK